MIKKDYLIFYLLLLTLVVSFAYILASLPFCIDELYLLKSNEAVGSMETIKSLYFTDNSRLSNVAVVLLLNLPGFFYKTIEILSLVIGLVLMLRLSDVGAGRWKALSFFVFMFVFAPMWQQSVFSFDYAYNYIVPVPLLFGMLYITLNSDRFPVWFGVLLGLLLGAWHESYSLLYLAGTFFVYISDRKWADKKRIIWFVAVLCGFLWIFLNPGSWNRAGVYYHLDLKGFLRPIVAWPYLLYVLVWIVCVIKKDLRSLALKPFMIFILGGCTFIPFTVLFGREISGMPAVLASICGLTVFLSRIARNVGVKTKVAVSVVLIICSVGHLLAVDFETSKICRVYKEVEKTLDDADPEAAYGFGKTYYSYEAPLVTLRMPYNGFFDPDHRTIELTMFYKGKNPDFIIVPETLRDFVFNEGRKTTARDVNIVDGYIVSSNLNDTIHENISVKYEKLDKWWNAKATSTVFKARDGREYVYIYPGRNTLTRFLGKPSDVRLEN